MFRKTLHENETCKFNKQNYNTNIIIGIHSQKFFRSYLLFCECKKKSASFYSSRLLASNLLSSQNYNLRIRHPRNFSSDRNKEPRRHRCRCRAPLETQTKLTRSLPLSLLLPFSHASPTSLYYTVHPLINSRVRAYVCLRIVRVYIVSCPSGDRAIAPD